jgi:hypothetical protein
MIYPPPRSRANVVVAIAGAMLVGVALAGAALIAVLRGVHHATASAVHDSLAPMMMG